MENARARFRPGQLVHHKLFGYRGVVVDVDATFQGTDEWYADHGPYPAAEGQALVPHPGARCRAHDLRHRTQPAAGPDRRADQAIRRSDQFFDELRRRSSMSSHRGVH